MKAFTLLLLFACVGIEAAYGQCVASFSSKALFEEVTFTNQSNVANAHCYWNFGDGSSSLYYHPVHKYPASGTYYVSLFVKDTVNNCTAYYDAWITVSKPESDPCQVAIDDSFFICNGKKCMTLVDRSINCHPLGFISLDMFGGSGIPYGNWEIDLDDSWQMRYVSRASYAIANTDTTFITRYAYKSNPYQYSSSKNYGPCSANFEFNTIAEDSTGRLILFSAMNKNAAEYDWGITGFGDPISSDKDTVSFFYRYPYPYYKHYPNGTLFSVILRTVDKNGCSDLLVQQINSGNTETYPQDIAPQPVRVYPNPFSKQTTIEFPLTNENEASLILYNGLGQIVRRIEHINIGKLILDRSGLPAGLYYFLLYDSKKKIGAGKLIMI